MAHPVPIDKSLFTFNHVLLVEVSNHSRHPRASVPEVRAILRPTAAADHDLSDPVGHWWEAQLLHYGLRPSKAKAVAKTRLLDALNLGTLAVPRDIIKLEAELKKQWAKQGRETRAGSKSVQSGSIAARSRTAESKTISSITPTAVAKGIKRKTLQNQGAATSTPTKRSKATAKLSEAPKSEAPLSRATNKKSKTPKATSTKPESSKFQASPVEKITPQLSPMTTNHPRRKQTARRSGGFLPPGREATNAHDSNLTRNSSPLGRVARRGGGFPLLKREAYDGDDRFDEGTLSDDVAMQNVSNQNTGHSQPLGLLNGSYEIVCPDLENWGYSSSDFSLILTLEGASLWGAYDFGMFEGILHLPTRPYSASEERIEFTWRGRENSEGETSFGPSNHGWIEFVGGGEIRGMINCYGEAMFEGRRISGNQTRSTRDARSMRSEWDGYNQQEYDRANRARWGGSGW